jgi:hypothetical protein
MALDMEFYNLEINVIWSYQHTSNPLKITGVNNV